MLAITLETVLAIMLETVSGMMLEVGMKCILTLIRRQLISRFVWLLMFLVIPGSGPELLGMYTIALLIRIFLTSLRPLILTKLIIFYQLLSRFTMRENCSIAQTLRLLLRLPSFLLILFNSKFNSNTTIITLRVCQQSRTIRF